MAESEEELKSLLRKVKEESEKAGYYTEWSKLERETPEQYINACIWNLERQ